MSKPHRIAAGGLTFKDNAVLLVRYRDSNGGTYLVGPGGALEDEQMLSKQLSGKRKKKPALRSSR